VKVILLERETKQHNKPLLGAHTSIAGGLHNALYSGQKIRCDVVQIFSKNQMQWHVSPLSDEAIQKFFTARKETGVNPVAVHDAYLINLASPDPKTYGLSFKNFTKELERCETLQIPYLVMHPGAHMGEGEEAGIRKIAESIQKAYEKSGAQNTTVLLETTAGQGTNLGYSFEQLKAIIDQSHLGDRIAVCLDTCHVFAAGYPIRNANEWIKTKRLFDQIIGLEKLKLLHLNDSKKELGTRRDRHERIGRGYIGIDGFSALLNDPDLSSIPMILEIPGGDAAYAEDLILLRSLND